MRAFLIRHYRAALLLSVFALLTASSSALPDWAVRFPEVLFVPIADWINASMLFLQDEFIVFTTIDEYEIEEETTLTMALTRGISDSIQFLLDVIRNMLLGGDKGLGLPALPWIAVAGFAFLIGHALGSLRLALLSGLGIVYLAAFGQWTDAMQTISLVFVAAPISLSLGLLLGVLAYRFRGVEWMLAPLLNVAQSLPHFSYLIPVVIFYGIGDHAGAVATIIFATPPMIRLTLLGLKKVPVEVVEAGQMSGCSNWQLLTRVQIPTARQDIMIGVNQVIMQCLAMVVIASFIGASGLGYSLLTMINSLKIGKALEHGVSIVLIAIILDRLSIAWAEKEPDYRADLPFYVRYKYWFMALAVLICSILLSKAHSVFYLIEEETAITTAVFWDGIVDWIVRNWSEALQAFRTFMLIEILIPMRDAYLAVPELAAFVLVGGAGWLLGGLRSMLTVTAFFFFIAVTGWWDRAVITMYMVSFAVIVSVAIGLLVGIVFSRNKARARFMLTVCDIFQTFPSFVYLIPVIMLFQVNDVSVIFAVVIYATIPAVRYVIEGLIKVDPQLLDSATMSGTSRWQKLLFVELPLAFPHIMIGVNQTVLFALFMVILGAFIGTQDLGQEIMQALSESDPGKGLVLGLCVAFIGLTVDHLIMRWAKGQKTHV